METIEQLEKELDAAVARVAELQIQIVMRKLTIHRAETAHLEERPARPPKAPKVVSLASQVWAAYSEAYERRYGVPPVRCAKTTNQARALAEQLGVELAIRVVVYYVGRQDSFYVKASHPIGVCLIHAQKLSTELQNGQIVTDGTARKTEKHDEIDRAVRDYAKQQDLEVGP